MFSSMHTKLPVLISTFHQSLLSLCMSLISTFLCWYIWSLHMPLIATFLSSYLRFVHAIDCYIFVIIKNMWWGEEQEIRTKLGVLCVKRLGLVMWFRHWNYMGTRFQASRCCTQTMTNGNAPCSLINLVFQLFISSKPYIQESQCDVPGMYQHLWWIIMIRIIMVQIKI